MAEFPIYLPWNNDLTAFVMKHAREGLYLLNLQLETACNANCPRCGSIRYNPDEPAGLNIEAICSLAEHIDTTLSMCKSKNHISNLPGGRNFGFICGPGEPTVAHNMAKLVEILDHTAKYGFSWSIFTNGIHWYSKLEEYMTSGRLFAIIQCNSNKPELVADQLGISSNHAAEHLSNRMHLQNVAKWLNEWHLERTGENFAGVAASIVPERDNLDELMDLIAECVDYGIFPLISELKQAGHCHPTEEYYEAHKLRGHELRTLHQQIEQRFGVHYETPTCPAIIGAIHVNNRNIVTVDEFTGLSCSQFGIGNSKVHEIGSICEMSYEEIVQAILDYRASRIPDLRKALNNHPETIFGGCGGNAHKLITDYVALYD